MPAWTLGRITLGRPEAQKSEPFQGVIDVDVRDSEPELAPIELPRVPDGAPSVLYVGSSPAQVADDYPGERPWRFAGGTIRAVAVAVAVDVSGDPYVDLERAVAAMIARE